MLPITAVYAQVVPLNVSTFTAAPPTDSGFVTLAGGEAFMCGLQQEGSYTCWGKEGYLTGNLEGNELTDISTGTSLVSAWLRLKRR